MADAMLGGCAIIAFVAISDAARARAFYEGTLGLKLVADEPFALVFDANGIRLRLAKMESVRPAPNTVLGWAVAEIDTVVDGLAARGVAFQRFPDMPQDERGVCRFEEGGRVAWFKDPDGNLLSLTQMA